jgi:hypothetical protein
MGCTTCGNGKRLALTCAGFHQPGAMQGTVKDIEGLHACHYEGIWSTRSLRHIRTIRTRFRSKRYTIRNGG